VAAVASKNLTIRFLADTSKWKPALKQFQRDIKSLKKEFSILPGFGKGGPGSPGGGGGGLPGSGKGGFFSGMFDKGGEATSLLKGDMSGALVGLASKFAIVTAAALLTVGSFQKVIDIGSQTRDSIVQFQTLLGGSEATAIKFFGTLKRFGSTTPLELPEINQAAKQLLAVKVAADDVVPSLRMLGDISKISGKNFNELATIYAKNKASNFIQGEDLNQLIEAGIPVLDEFSKMFGKSAIQVKEMGSKNQITFEHLQQAFKNMTGEGGLYFKGMERQAKEIPGIWSNIQDTWNDIFRAISGADLSSDTISFWSTMRDVLGDFSNRFSSFVESIRPLLVDFGTAIGSTFKAIWDVVVAIWDILKVYIIPVMFIMYNFVRGFLKVLIWNLQLISSIAKGISYVVNLVWSALDGLLGISEKIERVINFLQSLYIKVVTIFTATGIFIESMVDYMINGGLAKLGNAIYDAIVGGFTRAWEWVQSTDLYKLLGSTANKISTAASQGVQSAKEEIQKRFPISNLGAPPATSGNGSQGNSNSSVNNSRNSTTTINNHYSVKLNKQEEGTLQGMFNQTGRPFGLGN